VLQVVVVELVVPTFQVAQEELAVADRVEEMMVLALVVQVLLTLAQVAAVAVLT
jgi:hypothetical protein